jgi:hypothetical protein
LANNTGADTRFSHRPVLVGTPGAERVKRSAGVACPY